MMDADKYTPYKITMESLAGKFFDELIATGQNVSTDRIHIPEDRSRAIDEAHVQALMDDIEHMGLISPIGIRRARQDEKFPNGENFKLVYGAHRLLAWKRKFQIDLDAGGEQLMRTRWSRIPALVYEHKLSPKMEKLVELTENLKRKELTPAEKDRMTATALELMAGFTGENDQKGKKDQDEKMTNGLFSPPSRKEVLVFLNIPQTTFTREYRTYQTEVLGEKVNWSKLDEEQYKGFIGWFRERADKREAEEKEKEMEKQKAEEEKAERAREKAVEAMIVTLRNFHARHGAEALRRVLEEARRIIG